MSFAMFAIDPQGLPPGRVLRTWACPGCKARVSSCEQLYCGCSPGFILPLVEEAGTGPYQIVMEVVT